MKAKTIKAIIAKKINGWIETIEDPVVKKLAQDNTIVTGGCIASMLLNEKVNDFDIYFRTKDATASIAKYYVSRFKLKRSKGIQCKISVREEVDRVKIVIQSVGIVSEEGTDKP
jgi:hypothetical protein